MKLSLLLVSIGLYTLNADHEWQFDHKVTDSSGCTGIDGPPDAFTSKADVEDLLIALASCEIAVYDGEVAITDVIAAIRAENTASTEYCIEPNVAIEEEQCITVEQMMDVAKSYLADMTGEQMAQIFVKLQAANALLHEYIDIESVEFSVIAWHERGFATANVGTVVVLKDVDETWTPPGSEEPIQIVLTAGQTFKLRHLETTEFDNNGAISSHHEAVPGVFMEKVKEYIARNYFANGAQEQVNVLEQPQSAPESGNGIDNKVNDYFTPTVVNGLIAFMVVLLCVNLVFMCCKYCRKGKSDKGNYKTVSFESSAAEL